MKHDKMLKKLKTMINDKRYQHSIGVMSECVKLAEHFGINPEKSVVAGILHDCAKAMKRQELLDYCRERSAVIDACEEKRPELLHSKVGRMVAQEVFKIKNKEVLNAIENHTLGRPGMTMTEKIVFLADYIEPGRSFVGVEEIRKRAYSENIDETILYCLDETIIDVLKRGEILHPKTVETRNWYLELLNSSRK